MVGVRALGNESRLHEMYPFIKVERIGVQMGALPDAPERNPNERQAVYPACERGMMRQHGLNVLLFAS